jgi:hypothetical protein
LIDVKDGRVVEARVVEETELTVDLNLNWDLRALPEWWLDKVQSPPGYSGLGGAYMWGTLKFEIGNYSAMMKNPSMAGPFVHSFSLFPTVG